VLHDLSATWVWWGTALIAAVAIARHVAASRRVGREPSRVAIVVIAAVPIALAIAYRGQTPWIFIFFFVVPVGGFGWLWIHRDRTEIDLDSMVFSDELRIEVGYVDPPVLFGLLGSVTGRVRLLVGPGTIATRGMPSGGLMASGFRTPGTFGLFDFTFPAEDCEVERPRMGQSSFFVSLGKPAFVLRGDDGRRKAELVFSRPDTSLDDVQRVLIWAGARDLDGQFAGEPVALPQAGRTHPSGEQPPYWPPPPGWRPEGGGEA
jgi:hypothetical protein